MALMWRWSYCIAVYITLVSTCISMGDVRYRDGLRVLVWLLFLMAVPIARMVWMKRFHAPSLVISLWLLVHSVFWFLAIRLHNLLWPTWCA